MVRSVTAQDAITSYHGAGYPSTPSDLAVSTSPGYVLESDDVADGALRRLTSLGIELVPGGTAAGVTIRRPEGP